MFCFCLRYTFFSFCWFHKLFYTYRFVVIIDSLRHAWEPEDIQTHIWTCNLIKLYLNDFTVCLPVCQMTLKYIDLLLFYNELISTTIKKKTYQYCMTFLLGYSLLYHISYMVCSWPTRFTTLHVVDTFKMRQEHPEQRFLFLTCTNLCVKCQILTCV